MAICLDFDWQTNEFMLYCRTTQLREKTMLSYEQTLRLFEKEAHPFRENGCDVLPVFAFWRVFLMFGAFSTGAVSKSDLSASAGRLRFHSGIKKALHCRQ